MKISSVNTFFPQGINFHEFTRLSRIKFSKLDAQEKHCSRSLHWFFSKTTSRNSFPNEIPVESSVRFFPFSDYFCKNAFQSCNKSIITKLAGDRTGRISALGEKMCSRLSAQNFQLLLRFAIFFKD